MKRKGFWMVLLAGMVAVVLAVSMSAEEHSAIVDSGKCGDDLTWVLYEDGLLEISGTGEMWDYDMSDNPSPWQAYDIPGKHLYLEEGITYIGSYSFSGGYSWYTGDLNIPDGVTEIGEGAFAGANNFHNNLNLPNSLTIIGDYAFNSCSGFSGDLTLPDNLNKIGIASFYGCRNFTGSLVIPDSVTEIGESAFGACYGFTGYLILPECIKAIGDFAFYGCEGLDVAYFAGNAPIEFGELVFPESASCFTVYYINGKTGFTTPSWNGYPCSPVDALPGIAVTGISLSQMRAVLAVDNALKNKLTLGAILTPRNAADQSVIWTTSDKTVAIVEDGIVTAVGAGIATITATANDGGFSASCVVRVTQFLHGDVRMENGHTYNVLVLNFDPVFPMVENKRQHELKEWWSNPRSLADSFAYDMCEISYGYANYNIAEWLDLNEMPRNVDGKTYSLEEYYDMLLTADKATDGAYWTYSGWKDYGFSFDYDYYMSKYDVYNKVKRNEIDEVWIFTGPMVGVTLYETHMMGNGAFWCNSPGEEEDCDLFVVYGFNYERGVGEMLEDAGHRAESILNEVFGWPDYQKDYVDFTDWEKFTVYDLLKPGMSGPGNVHFAPNSLSDYDWGNTNYVTSFCNDWVNYPNLTGKSEQVNCDTWGYGSIESHHKWWFSMFPHVKGINPDSGKYNNWWIYFTLDYWNGGFDLAGEGITYVSGVSFPQKDVTVRAERSIRLNAVITPADATKQTLLWASSNPEIAEVCDGTVTGLKEGTAVITVTTLDGGFTAECNVTVKPVLIAGECERGDVTTDGEVDSNDAIYLLRHTMNETRYPINQSGDMNGDGTVDSNDAIYLLRHTMNPTRYPLGE